MGDITSAKVKRTPPVGVSSPSPKINRTDDSVGKMGRYHRWGRNPVDRKAGLFSRFKVLFSVRVL